MCKLGVWAIALLLVSGCYVDDGGGAAEVKKFDTDKVTVAPITAYVTLRRYDSLRARTKYETRVAISIESSNGRVANNIKINQIDQDGNPDPCPDVDFNLVESRYNGRIDGVANSVLQNDNINVKVRIDPYGNLFELTIQERSLKSLGSAFFDSKNPFFKFRTGDYGEIEGEIEVVEDRQYFNSKYFPPNTSGSTSCDEDS